MVDQDERTATAKRPGATATVQTHLVVVVFSDDPAARGAMVTLTDEELTVGRGAPNVSRLRFADPHLSRRHARLRPSGDRWEVSDLGSHNGTMLNGTAIASAALNDGDVLRCGGTMLVYRDVVGEVAMVPEAGSPLLGRSLTMSAVRRELSLAAAHDAPVLLHGESGVGKELAAEHLASHSPDRSHTLVALSCANLARDLAEAELFGHGAGAFTGASTARRGMFVSADGGTLFLDEIGEMSLDLQAKLLRALSTGKVRPVGADQPRDVDVRVVAATNRDLPAQVDKGRFRGDLYARLAAWSIHIPPLRQRREDILHLARHFLMDHDGEVEFTAEAAEALLLYDWPYNVRELRNVVTVSVARAGAGPIDVRHLPDALRPSGPEEPDVMPTTPSFRSAEERERETLASLLSQHRGNIRKVADELGRERRHVYRMLEKYELDADAYRRPSKDELVAELERLNGSVARVADALETNRRQIYRWLEEYSLDAASFRDGAG